MVKYFLLKFFAMKTQRKNERTCIRCQKTIKGRTDKKYCSGACRKAICISSKKIKDFIKSIFNLEETDDSETNKKDDEE